MDAPIMIHLLGVQTTVLVVMIIFFIALRLFWW